MFKARFLVWCLNRVSEKRTRSSVIFQLRVFKWNALNKRNISPLYELIRYVTYFFLLNKVCHFKASNFKKSRDFAVVTLAFSPTSFVAVFLHIFQNCGILHPHWLFLWQSAQNYSLQKINRFRTGTLFFFSGVSVGNRWIRSVIIQFSFFF